MQTIELCHHNVIQESQSHGFEISESLNIFAVRKDGNIYTYRNRCPHLGIELEWQEHDFLDNDKALIQCSTHGALFLIETGECVAGPCLGEKLIKVDNKVDDAGNLIVLVNVD